MKVSLITAVFNNRKYIEYCIKSVLDQTYENIEYIIIDGGSTDGTLEIIRNYEDKISRWVSKPDNGIYDAMNKGIKMASGDIIGFLHSDDFYANEVVIKKVADAFLIHGVQSVYSDVVFFNKSMNRVIRYWKAGEYKDTLIRRGWMPPHTAFFVRKEIYEKYGYFNTDLKIAADYELILRFLGKHHITTHYIPEVLIKMRMGGSSNGSVKNIIRKTMEDYKALKINGMNGRAITLLLKIFSKVPQFFNFTRKRRSGE
jgi:glycosyltransferase